LNPLESGDDVEHAEVSGFGEFGKMIIEVPETKRAESIIERDNDDIVVGEACAAVEVFASAAAEKAPQRIQTMTGSGPAGNSGVQTFKFKQSSPCGWSGVPSSPTVPSIGPCIAHARNAEVSRSPSHWSRGNGGRNRRSPTGGFA
jgi:hypothetical protein